MTRDWTDPDHPLRWDLDQVGILFGVDELPEPVNPWFDPPKGIETHRWIRGQFCQWDPDPAEEYGQVWIPVCPWCRRGPLDRDQVTCGACPPATQDPDRYLQPAEAVVMWR